MPLRILFLGDVHLGRVPARLPDDLGAYGIRERQLTPAAAWRAAVGLAAESGVDAVVLAGDVVEADNARFEAYGPLADGVARLAARGIPVLAVAGNHDVDALGRLADSIDGFRLLGRGGRWETALLVQDGRPRARLTGWSFPASRHPASPLEGVPLPFPREDGLPLLGVLHCDLLSAAGPYAPVAAADLQRANCDAWLLGHVHKPSELAGPRPIGYLGSLVGLDPTETGAHGPALVRVEADGRLEIERLALAPLRWEPVEADVSAIEDPGDVDGAIREAIAGLHRGLAGSRGAALAVGCRVTLRGATGCHRELRRLVEGGSLGALRYTHDGSVYFVERVLDASRPRIDLEALAAEASPPGILATHLLALERGDEASRHLIRDARRELTRVADQRTWSALDPEPLEDDDVRRLLLDAGMLALEELLEQSRGARP